MPLSTEQREMITAMLPFKNGALKAYWTKGGTYMIASRALYNDDDRPHDLLAVNRFGEVQQMGLVVPDFQMEVQAIISREIKRITETMKEEKT